jgi:hypothetical protein
MPLRFCLVTLSFLLLAACQYDPYAHRYTTERPNPKSVVGQYLIEFQTMTAYAKDLDQQLSKLSPPPSIVLHSDGRYEFRNVPNWTEQQTFRYRLDGFSNASGKWEFQTVGAIGDGSGKTKPHWGLRLTGVPSTMDHPGLINSSPPYEIIFGFGDPDAGEAMVFKWKG